MIIKAKYESDKSRLKRVLSDIALLNDRPEKDRHFVEALVELAMFLFKHKGRRQGVKDLKTYNTYLQLYCLKQNPANIPFRKTDKDNFPKVLKPWKSLANGNHQDVRFLMSLFRAPEIFRLEPEEDFESILRQPPEESKGVLFERFKNWLPKWSGLKALPSKLVPPGIILSNKQGPNGPASATAMYDLKALRQDVGLYTKVKELLRKLNSPLNLDQYNTSQIEGEVLHSRIVLLSDRFGKTRTVAIGDYWSNIALSGIHSTVMSGLRRLQTDLTYRQSSAPDLIKGLGTKLYSSDLTDATTLFPINWLEAVLSVKYGDEIANLWKCVMVDRDFSYRGIKLRYKSGNPMGLLSSWAVFTFTHHAIMEWCAYENKVRSYKYFLLGDDNLQSNLEVSNLYRKILVSIGVPISLSKCTQSEDGYAEFAKRLFTPNGEITGIPANLLLEVRKNPEQVIQLVRIMRERGYSEDETTAGVQAFLNNGYKHRNQVSLVLSAPEEITGYTPLKGLIPDETMYQYIAPDAVPLDVCLAKARADIFWGEVDKIAQYAQKGAYPVPHQGQRIHVPEDHPMLAEIGDQLMTNYLSSEEEYSVYERWMKGESYELAQVPSVDLYRYKNRSHKVNKAKYLIIKRTLAYANKSLDITSEPERPKISNFELFQLGFPSG